MGLDREQAEKKKKEDYQKELQALQLLPANERMTAFKTSKDPTLRRMGEDIADREQKVMDMIYPTSISDGDVSDSIPGIKGVGLKSLIKHFPFLETSHKYSIEDIIKSAFTQKEKYKLCEDITNSREQMLLNKKLMDLDELNISGNAKLKIQNIISNPIQRLVKHKFQKMFLEDKMYTALPNLNSWLHTTFNRLKFMAEKTHG